MTNDLQERLRSLAERAPAPRSGADLWRAGRRRQVRRAVAGAAATLLVALVAWGGMSALWTRLPEPAPVEGTPELVLPDQFFTPSAWLPGTDDEGPIGPLVAVFGANRKGWTGRDHNGLVGVSADGTYRFLDLPDATPYPDRGDQVLSADGRRLAFWYAGRPDGDPQLVNGNLLPYVGVAVYDTVTGRLTRHPIDTEHGVSASELAWSGDVVWFSYFQYNHGGGFGDGADGTFGALVRWDLATTEVLTSEDWRAPVRTYDAGPAPGGFVGRASRQRLGLAVTRGAEAARYVKPDMNTTTQSVSPDGRWLVGTYDPTPSSSDSKPLPLVAGHLPDQRPDGSLPMHTIGIRAWQVLGWKDATHVVVTRLAGKVVGAYAVDIQTGEANLLTRFDTGNGAPGIEVESDAWAAPVVQPDEPDWPMDPRLRVALWTMAIGALLVGLRILRRRRAGP